MTLTWSRVTADTLYYVCGGTSSGGENLIATLGGSESTIYIDTNNASTGGCPAGTITQPGIDLAGQIGVNWPGTIFENIIKAPPLAANVTNTLPSITGALPVIVAGGTAAMTTAAVAAGGCGTVVSPTATSGTLANVASTDSIKWSYNASPIGNPASLLVLNNWALTGSVNFAYCNNGATSQTPTAATINWQVTR
jgi:hypothetical protein